MYYYTIIILEFLVNKNIKIEFTYVYIINYLCHTYIYLNYIKKIMDNSVMIFKDLTNL